MIHAFSKIVFFRNTIEYFCGENILSFIQDETEISPHNGKTLAGDDTISSNVLTLCLSYFKRTLYM